MPPKPQTLTEADHGKTVETQVGAELVVRLHESASSGYTWSPDDLDPAISVPVKPAYTRRSDEVGGPSDVEWTLTANKLGTFRVGFKLWRPWEGDSSIQRRYSVTLLVRP
jgi:predicted secreted protein